MSDYECWDSALHPNPERRNEIWVNIGSEFGGIAQLTMGVGGASEDGFFEDYVVFAMTTIKEIDEVIAMLNEAKGLVPDYLEELEG